MPVQYLHTKLHKHIDPTFVPKFVVDGILFEDQSLIAPAIAFCNEKQMDMSRCLFDISVTGEVTNDSADFDDPTARSFFIRVPFTYYYINYYFND